MSMIIKHGLSLIITTKVEKVNLVISRKQGLVRETVCNLQVGANPLEIVEELVFCRCTNVTNLQHYFQ